MKKEVAVLLHNVRSAHNVGSIFRTADAAGVSKVYLSGFTPLPTDRFGRAQKEIAKTALGAEKFLSWEYQKTAAGIISKLRKAGWYIVAVEQDPRAVPYTKLRARNKTLYIFGNEVNGIPKSILDASDSVIEISMYGKKESLNVSVTAGIVLFRAVDSH